MTTEPKHKITFVRMWNPARDCIAVDQRGNRRQRGIYRHDWPTGSQILVFDTPLQAKTFEEALNEVQTTVVPKTVGPCSAIEPPVSNQFGNLLQIAEAMGYPGISLEFLMRMKVHGGGMMPELAARHNLPASVGVAARAELELFMQQGAEMFAPVGDA